MRASFAEGVDEMHIPWAVEGLPMLLHLSLFLFFGGLAIFLFNVDREVFIYVVWWIGLFLMVYGLITLLPIIRHDSPYHSPLSTPTWFLYASIHDVTFKILAFVTYGFRSYRTSESCEDRYQGRILGGVEKATEETASERSSDIDVQIFDWTISALGDDDSLKSFFEATPGFFNSKLVNLKLERDFPVELVEKFRDASDGFLRRTLSFNSVDDSEKVRRFVIFVNATTQFGRNRDLSIAIMLDQILFEFRCEVPQTAEMGHTLARLFTKNDEDVSAFARGIIAGILVSEQKRNDSWVTLAARVFGLPERDLRDNIALGDDSVLLAILLHVTRQFLRTGYYASDYCTLEALSKLDIRDTLPRLQHEFCTLWNEIAQQARDQEPLIAPVYTLREIRCLYIALHHGTDAAPTAFSASTDDSDTILLQPSSYPFCNMASPHVLVPFPTQPDYNAFNPFSSYSPLATTTSEIGTTSHGPDMTPPISPVHSDSHPTGASPTAVVAAAPQDITSTATLPHPPEGSEQQDSDVVAPSVEPGTGQIFSTASTHAPTPTLAPIQTSLPYTPSEFYDAGVASVSNPRTLLRPPSVPPSPPLDQLAVPRLHAYLFLFPSIQAIRLMNRLALPLVAVASFHHKLNKEIPSQDRLSRLTQRQPAKY
jgi:Family of unknown function (DUF6535)